ncbi:MAG: hypothetical protein LBQ31_01895 [Bacteroidales bacterium]|jgi:hypothetical protein|nr:hypothetical protein [Bacteroidales bacterium]
MKKNYFKIALIAMLSIATVSVVYAQQASSNLQKRDLKKMEKSAQKKAKDLTKKGWEIDGSSKSLEEALLAYAKNLAAKDGNEEVSGLVVNCNIPANCKTAAFNDAALQYALLTAGTIKSRMDGDQGLDQVSGEEMNKFYEAYETTCQKEIQGVLGKSPAFCLRNRTTKEYQVFYILNEDIASAARLRAMEQAFKETQAAQKYAKKISEYVNEAFKTTSILDE